MPLITSRGDFNLPTIAGMVSDLTVGHELPEDLYVYGIGERDDACQFYIDNIIPGVVEIIEFLGGQGIVCIPGLPNNPNVRPAIAIPRDVREHNVELSAKVCAFVLLCLHGTVALQYRAEEVNLFNKRED